MWNRLSWRLQTWIWHFSIVFSVAIWAESGPGSPLLPALVSAVRAVVIMSKRDQKAAQKALAALDNETPADARSRRTLRRNNTASIVQRILNETFPDFTDAEKDGVKVDGCTLRERLTKDKSEQRHNSGSKVVMGKKYYDQRRLDYASGSSSKSLLEVKNEKEVPCDKLLQAVKLARQACPQRGQLYDWLASRPLCSQSEMVGLSRFFLELKPWASDANLKMSVAMLKYWVRVGVENCYSQELEVARPQVDKTLVSALSTMKSANVPMKVFWSTYKDVAKYVVNTKDVDKLLAIKDDWSPVGSELEAVTLSSQLGMSMFGFALYEHQVVRCSSIIETEVQKLGNGHITVAATKLVHDKVIQLLEEFPGHEKLNVVRVVGISYSGTTVKVQVDTLRQEIELKIAAFVKTKALTLYRAEGKSKLSPLFCELALICNGVRFAHDIDDTLLVNYNLARSTANGMLPHIDHSNGLYVKNALDTKLDVLAQIDSTFVIEAAWFLHMHAAGGQALLEIKLLEPLPNTAGEHDPKKAYTALTLLKHSPLYSFVAPQHQAAFNVGVEMVKAVASDRLPSTKVTQESECLRSVLDRMAFYVHLAVPGSSDAEMKSFSGKEALAQKLQKVVDAGTAGEAISNERLKEFHTFNWLLSNDDKVVHNQLVSSAFHGVQGGLKCGAASSSSTVAKSGIKRKADSKTAGEKKLEQEEQTLKLFR
jgi:hypothetical protein